MPTLAVELMMGIARNHPFFQGNKRTGFAAGIDFLRINGFTVPTEMDSLLGWAVEGALLGPIPLGEFIEVIANMLRPLED